MAVGDYVLDGQQPPPKLTLALDYEKWGIPDIMRLPAGLLPSVNLCLNYYHALMGYKSASKTTDWANRNPQAWNMASWVISQRMERKRGNSDQ